MKKGHSASVILMVDAVHLALPNALDDVNIGAPFEPAGELLEAFIEKGGQVLAYRGIRLLGITVNPFSPTGASLDAQALLGQARLAFPDFIVTDVMLEKEGPCPASH